MLKDVASASETAAELEARLVAMGNKTFVSSYPARSILYSGGALMFRQKEVQTIYEYRGLTEAAATLLLELASHSASRVTMYAKIGSDGDAVAVGYNNGTDIDMRLDRVGDSPAYTVTRTEIAWSAETKGSWTTSRPTASGTGVVVSRSGSAQFLTAYMVNGVTHTFNTTESVEVTQYRFRTLSEATTLVNNNNSNSTSYQSYQYGSTGFYAVALSGTIKSATMRYVDNDNQYTVEVTTRTLGGSWS